MAFDETFSRAFTIASVAFLAASVPAAAGDDAQLPSSQFDLSHWKITLPMDANKDGKVDEKSVSEIKKYHHPDYFYLNNEGGLVFAAPNKATTTANSSNTRSELRQMIRGKNTRIDTHDPRNNFAVEARKGADKFGSIGGKLNATLTVDHVALNAGEPSAKAAYSVVVGQIHAVKLKSTASGFGYGNEPIKIYFKKLPGHEAGVVFWNYERNLAKDDPDRNDLSVPVFGGNWETKEDPGENGIKLGEEFSYEINVHRNTMYLTFHNERLGTVTQSRSLVRGADAKDNPYAYGGDSLYFKAGVYNQCSTKSGGGNWYAACAGTGDWAVDKANGDYAQATFSRIELSDSTPPDSE
ncbi:polysaccharide lyase family 7 protein [Erythrobacter crassostreae]|uniref:Polysaccharide lyase family 7 protein n=1 Tax=Erythrobacter crassostreae TaxID=2828328 RepID=A0A9X1JND3_9SPHN|nr:polysaccharide lyase family 7 protein [Erythrobacter crassostrea]MBV7258322.1 polysaccharide lyase family 7 protein [Erythrobacter crassostrea]